MTHIDPIGRGGGRAPLPNSSVYQRDVDETERTEHFFAGAGWALAGHSRESLYEAMFNRDCDRDGAANAGPRLTAVSDPRVADRDLARD
jgi:hypothetical protein